MKNEVAEMLECALINCDNVRKVGLIMLEMVEIQIQSAIDLLEEKNELV